LVRMNVKPSTDKTFATKLIISSFNKSAKSRTTLLKSELKNYAADIISMEQSLTNLYTKRIGSQSELDSIGIVEEDAIKLFVKEIETCKKQQIITDVTLDNGKVNITFIPTTVKTNLGRNIEGDAKKGPIVEMFVGPITCHISGNGIITVTSPHTCGMNAHPHANTSGNPCLGGGDGPSMMHKMIAQRKFSAFVYYFWMWIKKHRGEDCYVKPHDWYDYCLKNGLPVFDQNGKRIKINDETKIKKKEQQKLVKTKNYETNMVKYAKFKL